MKKLLFMLVAATTFFSSCSSDDDGINGNANQHEATKYKVNLNVKSAGFEIDKTPLKAITSKDVRKVFQYVVYNEDATVYSDSVYLDAEVLPMINDSGDIPIQLELPEGKYHLAIVYVYNYSEKDPAGNTYYKLYPKNFDTDYYSNTPPFNLRWDNKDVYYQVIDLTVSSIDNNNTTQIELEPMWSEVELKLTNITKAKLPVGTFALRVVYVPNYSGFSIKTKIANFIIPPDVITRANVLYPTNDDTLTMNYLVAKGEDTSMGLRIDYLGHSEIPNSGWQAFAHKDIQFTNQLENGNYYKITGKLEDFNDAKDSIQSFNISLGSFAKDDVNIEF